jgi:hypothetical protein
MLAGEISRLATALTAPGVGAGVGEDAGGSDEPPPPQAANNNAADSAHGADPAAAPHNFIFNMTSPSLCYTA